MNFFVNAFNLILYQPLFNALVLLYQYLPGHDFGVAVLVLTILIKFLFYPLGTIAIRSQKNLSDLQPKLKEIQQKYKDDKERQAKVDAINDAHKGEKGSQVIQPGVLPDGRINANQHTQYGGKDKTEQDKLEGIYPVPFYQGHDRQGGAEGPAPVTPKQVDDIAAVLLP